jgi:hypothetical protein
LSHQGQKIKHGEAPLPITTGIRVRKDLPASQFSGTFKQCLYTYFLLKKTIPEIFCESKAKLYHTN